MVIMTVIITVLNFLKLNDSKTIFIMFRSPRDLDEVREGTVDVADARILLSESIRNIVTMTDTGFTMEHHVSTSRTCVTFNSAHCHKSVNVEHRRQPRSLTAYATAIPRSDKMKSIVNNVSAAKYKKPQVT